MFEQDAAAQATIGETYEFSDVLSESAIDQQNRLTAQRNAQRREVISRDRGTSARQRLRSATRRPTR